MGYKERFQIEYRDLFTRITKLEDMLSKWEYDELDFTPVSSKELLSAQLASMLAYLTILEERARLEGIDISVIRDSITKTL